jgi:murein tripeptide amidase MpaA
VEWNTHPRYDELTRILKEYSAAYPRLFHLESIGKSYEGREVWLATVTNLDTGPAREKPALWIDGNIHATELTASSACLYFLHTITSGYGKDADITRCLDTRAFYVCPRVNPDGAEWALAENPKLIRSSTRPYPYDEEAIEGLRVEDIDGDGRILSMRIQDPNGPWKSHPNDPRLLVRRDPAEAGAVYYRVLPEGRLEHYDGITIGIQPDKEGLDLNRNFPINWRQHHEQEGAGPFPASEPETRNVMGFIADHPNITGGVAFHTYGGVILRPYDDRDDKEFPAEDLWTYQKIGAEGTAITGYPNVSVYHDFRYHPKEVVTGTFDSWMYDHNGVFAWTVEVWSPQREAGILEYKFIDWYREHPVEDDLKLLRWNDEKLGRKGYVDWYPFQHPELGAIELGGWNSLQCWRNPPSEFLQRELAKFPRWLVWHCLISPRLEILEANAKSLGEGTYRIRLVVQNTGWLPTYVTKKALEKKLRGVVCEIELPSGAVLETGKSREEIGHLEGRAYKSSACVSDYDPTVDRGKVEWTVRAPASGIVRLIARHDRAGWVRAELTLRGL